jgi:hypothetical protein
MESSLTSWKTDRPIGWNDTNFGEAHASCQLFQIVGRMIVVGHFQQHGAPTPLLLGRLFACKSPQVCYS